MPCLKLSSCLSAHKPLSCPISLACVSSFAGFQPTIETVAAIGIAIILRPPVFNKNFRWKKSIYTTAFISFLVATAALLQVVGYMTPPALRVDLKLAPELLQESLGVPAAGSR